MLYRNGWQDSEVSTKYVYLRLNDILDMYKDMDMMDEDSVKIALSSFCREICRTYFADTGNQIGSPHDRTVTENIL